MSVLSRYILRMTAPRYLMIALAVTALTVLLDTANQGNALWNEGGVSAVGRYAMLRAPLIFISLSVFSALIAILVTLTELVRRSELVAIQAAGWSQFNLMAAFLPAVIVMAGLHYIASDFAAPPASKALKDWGFDEAVSSGEELWMRSGSLIVRAGAVDTGGGMRDVTVFDLNADGVLAQRITAGSALFESGEWGLRGAQAIEVAGGGEAANSLPINLSPRRVGLLASEPRNLSFASLNALIGADSYGARPGHVYRLWRMRKLAEPFSVVIMALLAIPLVQRFQRKDATPRILALGIALGFSYLALDYFMVALGESGMLPAPFAVFGATAVFGIAGLAFMLQRDTL